jgi:hypothetical protein
MHVALELDSRLVGLEAALFEDFDLNRGMRQARPPVSRSFSGTSIILGLPHK